MTGQVAVDIQELVGTALHPMIMTVDHQIPVVTLGAILAQGMTGQAEVDIQELVETALHPMIMTVGYQVPVVMLGTILDQGMTGQAEVPTAPHDPVGATTAT